MLIYSLHGRPMTAAAADLIMDVEGEASVTRAEEDSVEDTGSLALGHQVPLEDHLRLVKAWKEQLLGDVDTTKLGGTATTTTTSGHSS